MAKMVCVKNMIIIVIQIHLMQKNVKDIQENDILEIIRSKR